MFSHKAFLKLGDFTGTDLISLVKGGYELTNCTYVFQQGTDDKGDVSTDVSGGIISLSIPALPPKCTSADSPPKGDNRMGFGFSEL